jgi:hypothetical protein
MDRVVEPANTPAKAAHTATAALSMAGAGRAMLTARRAATAPSGHALVAHLQQSSHPQNRRQLQHVRLQLHPQHPPTKCRPMPPADPTTAGPRASVALLATAAVVPGGVVQPQITADRHASLVSETVVVTTQQAQARQSQQLLRLLVVFSNV